MCFSIGSKLFEHLVDIAVDQGECGVWDMFLLHVKQTCIFKPFHLLYVFILLEVCLFVCFVCVCVCVSALHCTCAQHVFKSFSSSCRFRLINDLYH
jgi:hypothetical protein